VTGWGGASLGVHLSSLCSAGGVTSLCVVTKCLVWAMNESSFLICLQLLSRLVRVRGFIPIEVHMALQ